MGAYYNEIDPFAAQWLRELIKAGHIAPGDVDERDIRDVNPDEVRGYTQCHWFAGIGVWSYALQRAGWPDDEPVWTGSCPCQPFSSAGKRSGTSDERHLWPSFFHLIENCSPPVVFGEQVASKDGLTWLDLVQDDMEGAGYSIWPFDLCAAGFGAPHIRQRLYFVADSGGGASEWGTACAPGTQATGGRARLENGSLPDGHSDGSKDGSRQLAIANCDERWADGRAGNREAAGIPAIDRATISGSRKPGGAGAPVCHCGATFTECEHPGIEVTCVCGERVFREEPCPFCGVAQGDTDNSRPQGWRLSGERARELFVGQAGVAGFWRDADWLWCRDQKYRPVEPGTFPLAHGAPARVGRLRGYGNAIVAEQAAEFIAAYISIQD